MRWQIPSIQQIRKSRPPSGLGAFISSGFPPLLAVGSLLWLGRVLLAETPRPPIGVYIAVLAALAVVVTIWPPESNLGKAAWLAAFFALTGLEIATLYQERTENQKQQAEARRKEAEAFQSIADGSPRQ
jgi:hypothetical protein